MPVLINRLPIANVIMVEVPAAKECPLYWESPEIITPLAISKLPHTTPAPSDGFEPFRTSESINNKNMVYGQYVSTQNKPTPQSYYGILSTITMQHSIIITLIILYSQPSIPPPIVRAPKPNAGWADPGIPIVVIDMVHNCVCCRGTVEVISDRLCLVACTPVWFLILGSYNIFLYIYIKHHVSVIYILF